MFYFDPYARAGKRSGAWMNAYRNQERFEREITTLVSNNSNFMKGAAGEPVLVSWDDARTLFHEFGHALHGLCSDVTYPSLSGTSVRARLRRAALADQRALARHARGAEPFRPSLPDRPADARRPRRAHQESLRSSTKASPPTEFLASGLIDMKLHLAGDRPIDPAAFEREELDRLGMPAEIVMRHRLPQFAHIFCE